MYSDINNIVNNTEAKFNEKNKANKEKLDPDLYEDENIKFLQSIRSIVSNERAEFVDKIIELYNSGAFKDFSK